MTFDVAPEVYDAYMGRFSAPLARLFAEWADLPDSGEILDVGSGPGALTAVLVERYDAASVTAIDPSATFVAAIEQRLPGVEARLGAAEALPFPDDSFDASLAALVVHFMADAAAGAAEMVRVTRTGGVVAACVWDQENDRGPFSPYLRAVRAEAGPRPRRGAPGTRRGDLVRLLEDAGCTDTAEAELEVAVGYETFDGWWDVHVHGTGTIAGALDGLDADAVARVRSRAFADLGEGPFTVRATAWTARGLAP